MTATDEDGGTPSYLGRKLKRLSPYAEGGRIVSVLSLPQKEFYKGQGVFPKQKTQLNKKEQKRHSEAIIINPNCGEIDPKLGD